MKLCGCPAPLRSTASLERLRCLRCAGWTPHGRLPTTDHGLMVTNEIISLAAKMGDDYPWVHSLACDPARRGHSDGRNPGVSDPTLNAILTNERRPKNQRRPGVVDYGTIAARLTERALKALRAADEAIGEALLAAELPGPADHTKAAYHDTGGLRYPDPNIYAAQTRRHSRGEGAPQ